MFYLAASAAMKREGPDRDYTSTSADKAADTFKRSSPRPLAASTSCAACSATTDPPNSPPPMQEPTAQRLDEVIEIPSLSPVVWARGVVRMTLRAEKSTSPGPNLTRTAEPTFGCSCYAVSDASYSIVVALPANGAEEPV